LTICGAFRGQWKTWRAVLSSTFSDTFRFPRASPGAPILLNNIAYFYRQYANIIFINQHRLDTSKKKLLQYTFSDFQHCASVIIQFWTVEQEFDTNLAQDVRDIKSLLAQNKEVQDELRTVVTHLLSTVSPSAMVLTPQPTSFPYAFFSTLLDSAGKDFASQFRILVRNMLNIGSSLVHAKSIRDLFLNLVEKVVEPCVAAGWRQSDADAFFEALEEAWCKLILLPPDQVKRSEKSWRRLVRGIRLTAIHLFNDISVALSANPK
jgi:hypothetical protein